MFPDALCLLNILSHLSSFSSLPSIPSFSFVLLFFTLSGPPETWSVPGLWVLWQTP